MNARQKKLVSLAKKILKNTNNPLFFTMDGVSYISDSFRILTFNDSEVKAELEKDYKTCVPIDSMKSFISELTSNDCLVADFINKSSFKESLNVTKSTFKLENPCEKRFKVLYAFKFVNLVCNSSFLSDALPLLNNNFSVYCVNDKKSSPFGLIEKDFIYYVCPVFAQKENFNEYGFKIA